MRLIRLTIAAAAVAAATAAVAQSAVEARENLMKAQGGAVKVLADMAKGTTAFDADAAAAAQAKLVELSEQIAVVFESDEMTAESAAKPEIWTNYADFTSKADTLVLAAESLDTSSVEGIQAGLGNVGGACGACHEAYRVKR